MNFPGTVNVIPRPNVSDNDVIHPIKTMRSWTKLHLYQAFYPQELFLGRGEMHVKVVPLLFDACQTAGSWQDL